MAKPLNHDQQAAIDRAASVLHRADQITFRQRVLEQLRVVPELGDGIVYRTCAQVQKALFKPPTGVEHEPRQLKRFG